MVITTRGKQGSKVFVKMYSCSAFSLHLHRVQKASCSSRSSALFMCHLSMVFSLYPSLCCSGVVLSDQSMCCLVGLFEHPSELLLLSGCGGSDEEKGGGGGGCCVRLEANHMRTVLLERMFIVQKMRPEFSCFLERHSIPLPNCFAFRGFLRRCRHPNTFWSSLWPSHVITDTERRDSG